MSLNLFQIISLFLIIFFIFRIWLKYRVSLIFNYIIGVVFVILYNVIGGFSSEGPGGGLILMVTLFLYSFLFASSFCINFIEEDFRKKFYFLFPCLFYCIIVFIEFTLIDPHEHFDSKFYGSLTPIFLAYFPLYILLYYKKFKDEE